MDNFKDSYVILFRNVTKSIEHLEKLKANAQLSEDIYKEIDTNL